MKLFDWKNCDDIDALLQSELSKSENDTASFFAFLVFIALTTTISFRHVFTFIYLCNRFLFIWFLRDGNFRGILKAALFFRCIIRAAFSRHVLVLCIWFKCARIWTQNILSTFWIIPFLNQCPFNPDSSPSEENL